MKIKIIHFIGAIALNIALVGCVAPNRATPAPESYVPKEPVFEHQKSTFTDQRDNKTYGTVVIGSQTWMAENLNYDVEGGKCYNNDESNCQKYGKLYNWLTVVGLPSKCQGLNLAPDFSPGNSTHVKREIDADCVIKYPHQGICPDGWHLPSNAEWTSLIGFASGNRAGIRLKASSGWDFHYGSDSYGFAALPGGFYGNGRDENGRIGIGFYGTGSSGYWWTATGGYAPGVGDVAYARSMVGHRNSFSYMEVNEKAEKIDYSYSVRCLQN